MHDDHRGVWYGFSAYFLWGMFPLYFQLLTRSGAFEIVAYRVVFSLVFCLLGLMVLRQWRQVRRVMQNRRATVLLAVAGIVVTGNWTLYVWGVNNGFAIDAALGYFMNPLVNAAFGVLLLGERMRRAQWAAFAVGGGAVVVLIVAYRQIPWVAIGLALSFGVYGLLKNRIGAAVPPLPGLAVESCSAAPFALAYLVWLAAHGRNTVTLFSGYGLLTSLAGPVTAVPLLLFAAAAARVKLSTMGVLQYVAPIMQFLIGWLIIGEQMPPARWLGFSIIWVAVAIFVLDAFGWLPGNRRGRQDAGAPPRFPT